VRAIEIVKKKRCHYSSMRAFIVIKNRLRNSKCHGYQLKKQRFRQPKTKVTTAENDQENKKLEASSSAVQLSKV
jgi:hypothetical protein